MKGTSTTTAVAGVANWAFSAVFLTIGVLNILLVHIVPGIFYILLFMLYLPVTERMLKKWFKLSISPVLKAIVGFVILWGTLAVGDLAEILGM